METTNTPTASAPAAQAQSLASLCSSRTLIVTDKASQFEVHLPNWFPAELTEQALHDLAGEFPPAAILAKALAQVVIDLREAARRGFRAGGQTKAQQLVDKVTIDLPRSGSDPTAKAASSLSKLTPDQIRKALIAAGIDLTSL